PPPTPLVPYTTLFRSYDRHAWEFRPLILTHEALARQGRTEAAVQWEEAFTEFTSDLARHYIEELEDLEREHGIRLRTVSDRVHEDRKSTRLNSSHVSI